MKVCYKCGHHTEKYVEIPVVIKEYMEDEIDGGYEFYKWKFELRPYCCFCTKIEEPERELTSIEIDEEKE